MTTIVFLSADSMNDALGAAGRTHRALFESLGYDFVDVNLARPDGHQLLNRTLQENPIEFAYSAVGLGADFVGARPDGSQVNLWEANRIPYISFSGDSPVYFFQ